MSVSAAGFRRSSPQPLPRPLRAPPPHPGLDAALRALLALGVTLVLLVPAARATHPLLGWGPLWLVAMPASAWWALHRFPWPGQGDRETAWRPALPARPRRRPVQARRRPRVRPGQARAA